MVLFLASIAQPYLLLLVTAEKMESRKIKIDKIKLWRKKISLLKRNETEVKGLAHLFTARAAHDPEPY